jgi:hypothetical protein
VAKPKPDYRRLAQMPEADFKETWLKLYGQPQRANETYRTNSDGSSWLGGQAVETPKEDRS